MPSFDWLLPAVVGALCTVTWWMGRGVMDRLDQLQEYMRNELRSMDVRLSVVEAMLEIKRPHR